MNTQAALSPILADSRVELALAGWLQAHGKTIIEAEAEGRQIKHTRTSKAYEETMRLYRATLAQIGLDVDSDVTQVTMIAQQFAAFSARRGRAANTTINQRLAILSSFYEYALARKLLRIEVNPIRLIKREKVQQYAGAQPLDAEDVAARLKSIDRSTALGKRDYALLAVLLQTGRRLHEVADLQWRHVTLQGQKATLTFDHCKGGKIMHDTLPAPVARALLEWLHEAYGRDLARLPADTPLWMVLSRNTQQHGKPLGIQAVAGLCEKYLNVSKVHATRHTWAHNMIEAGATINEIQARLGHESLATTGRYVAMLQSAENRHADTLAAMLGIE